MKRIVLAAILAGAGVSNAAEPRVLGAPSGTGAFPAIAESRADLPGHTIYRPAVLPAEPLPVFVWANGACRDNGLQHAAFLRQIASNGYFVVALGRPRTEERAPAAPAQPRATPDETRPAQILEAIEWAARQDRAHVDASRVAVGGHSCGGLQALSVSQDPRVRTTLVLNSGIYVDRSGRRSGVAIDKSQLARLHAPLLYLTGGPEDMAHPNTVDDYERITALPVFLASLPVGHDGTFWSEPDGGAWARVATRWLDWRLKADADASWDFAGPACRLCKDSRWAVRAKNLGLPAGPFRQSLYVPVRDGTRLAMNVYRAARDGVPIESPQPVIFSFTPYRARYRDERTGRVIEFGQFPQGGHLGLLEQGYVLAVADIRGKGASFGARRGFSDRTEALDGRDLVQWLASQPWSSGHVGMYGCSYLGGTTVHVASARPPALRAIFTGATDLDKFAFVRNGGITAQFNTRPDEPLSDDLRSVPLDEDVDGSLLQAAVAMHARNTPMAALWYGMPFRDSVSAYTGTKFWEESSPYTYLDALKGSGIATYYWSNWEDEPTAQVLIAAKNLGSRVLIGPGSHCVTPPGFDFAGEVRRYFDGHLKSQPALSSARVTWFLHGAPAGQEWQHSEHLPGEDVKRESWLLAAGNSPAEGALGRKAAGGAKPVSFRVDYALPSPEGFALWIDSQHGRGASFVTPPFDQAVELVGFPVVDLEVSSSAAEPLVFAYLEVLSPTERARVIGFGRLGAAYRTEGRAPYDTLGLPWHTGLQKDHAPLVANRPVRLRLALTPTAHRFEPGTRLRLVVTGADPRQRNLQDIRIDPAPTISIGTGRRAASRIELPLRRPQAP